VSQCYSCEHIIAGVSLSNGPPLDMGLGVSGSYFLSLSFLWRCAPKRVMASSFMRFLDHTNDAPQSVRLHWTSDQLVAQTST
jgi:hypothetical protein